MTERKHYLWPSGIYPTIDEHDNNVISSFSTTCRIKENKQEYGTYKHKTSSWLFWENLAMSITLTNIARKLGHLYEKLISLVKKLFADGSTQL